MYEPEGKISSIELTLSSILPGACDAFTFAFAELASVPTSWLRASLRRRRNRAAHHRIDQLHRSQELTLRAGRRLQSHRLRKIAVCNRANYSSHFGRWPAMSSMRVLTESIRLLQEPSAIGKAARWVILPSFPTTLLTRSSSRVSLSFRTITSLRVSAIFRNADAIIRQAHRKSPAFKATTSSEVLCRRVMWQLRHCEVRWHASSQEIDNCIHCLEGFRQALLRRQLFCSRDLSVRLRPPATRSSSWPDSC